MRKLKLFKTLLVAAGLTMGASAWADSWSIDFKAIAANYPDKTNLTISSKIVTIGGTDMGTCTVNGSETVLEALDTKFVLQTGTTWMLRTKNNGLYQGNGGGRAMGILSCTKDQIITIVGTGEPNASTNVTKKSQEGNTYVYTVNADGDVKFTPARYLYFYSITVEDPSASAVDYTVKYVDGDGNEIKDHSTYSGEVGEGATISSTDKANIWKEGVKYIYVSDDSEGKTIAADGSTVITVTYRTAALYSYTINAYYNGSLIEEIGTGSVYEGEKAYAVHKLYYLIGNTLIKHSSDDGKTYNANFTPTKDGAEYKVEYTATNINDVVFYKEAEDIESLEQITSAYLPERFSGNRGAYAKEEAKVITTLAPGKYKLTAHIMGTMSACTFTFKAGNEIIWENATGSGSFYIGNGSTSDEFTITEATDITLEAAGGDGSSSRVTNSVDFVYIQRTDIVPVKIGSTGYATYSNVNHALDFTGLAVKAYKASLESDNTVLLTPVDKVPAGEGVVLAGAAATYDVPVIASADALTGNLLKASKDEEIAASTEGTFHYVLANGSNGVGFYNLAAAKNIGAGKAYLETTTALATSSSARVAWRFADNEATGISALPSSGSQKAEGIYSLSGQRVSQPTKGLYIVNGKKVIMK